MAAMDKRFPDDKRPSARPHAFSQMKTVAVNKNIFVG